MFDFYSGLLVYIDGTILIILLYMAGRFKDGLILLGPKCKTDYVFNVLRHEKFKILREIALGLLGLSAVFLIWEQIKFNIYIPPEYIPREITDFSFIKDNVLKNIKEAVSGLDYSPSYMNVKMEMIFILLYRLFFISLFIGFPLLFLGFYQLNLHRVPFRHTLLLCSLIFAAATVVVTLAAFAAGLPVKLESGSLAVMFAFIYMKSIIYSIKEV